MIAKYPRRKWMFVHWMDVAWDWRNTKPTVSCMVTGLWGVVGLLAGIVSLTSNSVGSGVFFSLIGVGLLGLVIYAGYNTHRFQEWKHTVKGTEYVVEGHSLARSIGPLTLWVAILASIAFLGLFVLTTTILSSLGSSHR
jgi:hypothetical protein